MVRNRSMIIGPALTLWVVAGMLGPLQASAQQADELEALLPPELDSYVLQEVTQEAETLVRAVYRAQEAGENPVNLILAHGGDGEGLYQQVQQAIASGQMDDVETQVGDHTFVGFKDGNEFIVLDHFDGFTLAAGFSDVDPEAEAATFVAPVEDFLEEFDPARIDEDALGAAAEAAPGEGADGLCTDMDCFADRVSECQDAQVGASLGPGLSAVYQVEGPADGDGCRISFWFDENPNPEVEGEPLHFTLPEGTPWSEETVQEVMEGCLGQEEEAMERYDCSGPLLEAMEED